MQLKSDLIVEGHVLSIPNENIKTHLILVRAAPRREKTTSIHGRIIVHKVEQDYVVLRLQIRSEELNWEWERKTTFEKYRPVKKAT